MIFWGDINNLRLNFYNGACGYLKLNNIDSTLKRTYSFNDDNLLLQIILMENLLILIQLSLFLILKSYFDHRIKCLQFLKSFMKLVQMYGFYFERRKIVNK